MIKVFLLVAYMSHGPSHIHIYAYTTRAACAQARSWLKPRLPHWTTECVESGMPLYSKGGAPLVEKPY